MYCKHFIDIHIHVRNTTVLDDGGEFDELAFDDKVRFSRTSSLSTPRTTQKSRPSPADAAPELNASVNGASRNQIA